VAQLDQLIEAMFEHQAEALVLQPGQRPSLLLAGTERPIVKSALVAAHVSRLAAEIAPSDQRAAVAAGGVASFDYKLGGQTVKVEVSAGPKAVIRASSPTVPSATTTRPGAATAASAKTVVAEAPAPPAKTVAAEAPAPPAKTVAPPPSEAAAAPVEPVPAGRVAASGDPPRMDSLLRRLVERGGSDLHLSSGCRPMIRVDGEMEPVDDLPEGDPAKTEQLLLSIAPERNRAEFREHGDTDFAYEIAGLCRFRSNLFRDRRGAGGVFRVIPSKILTVEDLNLSEAIRSLCFLTKGLVLVTGPTGSGKSTTLCALVDHVNCNRSEHIITIEDPIEFVHPNKRCLINQREVHLHTAGFKKALRAALREDPDVVLVGEMRDLETVSIAIETAETGHLVFGTLHTSSAVSTVDRIIDQFPADQQAQIRIMLSESLRAVIAQVLCRKIGGGRVAALEVLIVNAAVSNLIREGKTFQIPSIMQTSRAQGNVLLNTALLDLVKKKLVEPREAYVKCRDKQNLVTTMQQAGVPVDFLKSDDMRKELEPA